MGVFKRPDSKYWWLYLETTRQRERTDILLGDTIAQRTDAKRLAKEAYQRRMLELAEQKVKRLPHGPPMVRFRAYADTYARDVIALRRGAQRL